MRHFFTPLFVAATLLALPASAQETPPTPTITLQGVGEVTAAPDMATLTTGVVTQGDTARAALDQNNVAAADLMQTLRDNGVADRDLQTSNFSIRPLYEQQPSESSIRRDPEIIGYQVSNTVSVRVRDLARLGVVLDQMVTSGANSINGINFLVSEAGDLENAAREAAVADALAKAELYASAAGVSLVRILEISETDYGRPQQENFAMARMASDMAEVPVASGELTFSSRINIVWEIAQD